MSQSSCPRSPTLPFSSFLKISNSLVIHSLLDLGVCTVSVCASVFRINLHHSLSLLYRLVVLPSEQVLLGRRGMRPLRERVQLNSTLSFLDGQIKPSYMA